MCDDNSWYRYPWLQRSRSRTRNGSREPGPKAAAMSRGHSRSRSRTPPPPKASSRKYRSPWAFLILLTYKIIDITFLHILTFCVNSHKIVNSGITSLSRQRRLRNKIHILHKVAETILKFFGYIVYFWKASCNILLTSHY